MSDTTKIEWAHSTFNPWIGCTKVSPGCALCYAENTTRARVLRSKGQEIWGKGHARVRTSAAYWKGPAKWNEQNRREYADRMEAVYDGSLEVERRRHRVFPSLCDWLDDEVPIEWLADFLKLIHATPNLDWLLLTKRPENWCRRLLSVCACQAATGSIDANEAVFLWIDDWLKGVAPANVWIGTSVEDQPRADERIPELLKIPGAVRFLSVEPLIEPVTLRKIGNSVDWVIVGGESGHKARPCNVEWIRIIVRQCQSAGVACFVKQLGSLPYGAADGAYWRKQITHPKGGDPKEWPEDLRLRQFPNRKSQIANRQ